MKRLMAVLLVFTILLSMTACSENTDTSADTAPSLSSAYEKDESFTDEVTLKWVFPALNDFYPGFDAIQEKLNEITKEKINAKIEFEMIPLIEYTDRMNMKFIAGEEFDLCFTGAWNPYLPAASKGAYAELTQEVLEQYAPDVMKELSSAVWDAVRINGKIYGIPIQQIHVRQTGIRFNTELLKKYGFDPGSLETLDDLDAYAQIIKVNEPDAIPIYNSSESTIYSNMVNYFGYDVLVSQMTPGVVY